MAAGAPASTLRALLGHVVDYAGLFPPAALSMRDAAAAYAEHLEAPEAWMLGRFVVPLTRAEELLAELARHHALPTAPWRISALAGADLEDDVARLRALNEDHGRRMDIDVVELKLSSPEAVTHAARTVGNAATLYVELPLSDEPRPLLDAVRAAGVRAKIRTGGLTADAIPSAAHIARFISRCAELRVPFKATAGLHHPLRAEHRLTYESDAPRGTMFGFLNVFAAGAFALAGMSEPDLARLLDERDLDALVFDDAGLRWRGRKLSLSEISEARGAFAIAFGSCSFREPVADLQQLGLL